MSPERYLRTFDVPDLLVRNKDGLRLTEIREALQLPVSSVHNMLHTMVAAQVLSVGDDLRYAIGARVVGIALSTRCSTPRARAQNTSSAAWGMSGRHRPRQRSNSVTGQEN